MKFKQKLDNFFEISARNSTFKAEIVGGITTFFAMCYIMMVNPDVMSSLINPIPNAPLLHDPQIFNAVYIATAIGAIVGTLLYAVYAKMPFAQAPGMGLNAFFMTTFMFATAFGAAVTPVERYSAGMSVIFVSGLLFMLLSVTGLRKKIAEAMPMCLKKAIPAGIGLFIAFIGLQGSKLIVANPATLVQLNSFNVYGGNVAWFDSFGAPGISAPIATFLGFMVIAALSKTKARKFNVIIGILFTTCLYYLFNAGNDATFAGISSIPNINEVFSDFGEVGVQGWFKGFQYWQAADAINIILLVITFCLVDMFDTLGTLQGTAAEAGMLDENGNPQNLNKSLMADSTATVFGSMMGTSTVTTFVESSAGVAAGARTGFSSLVVAFLFLIAMFLSPLAKVIPGCATAPALMYVGLLMVKNFKDVDFSDLTSALPAFLSLIMMPLTYSISNGIAMGMISYIILKFINVFFTKDYSVKEYFALKGEFFQKDIFVLIIAVLFLVRFFMVNM